MTQVLELSDENLQELYAWVDGIPLSRPKKNIARDFSDGVMLAEVVMHHIPKLVQIHNYSNANGMTQKMYNWQTLCRKVLTPLGIILTKDDVKEIVLAIPLKIESVLILLKQKINDFDHETKVRQDKDEDGKKDHQFQTDDSNAFSFSSDKNRIQELEKAVRVMELKIYKMTQLLEIKDIKLKAFEDKEKGKDFGNFEFTV